jgi:hypothetical protein
MFASVPIRVLAPLRLIKTEQLWTAVLHCVTTATKH